MAVSNLKPGDKAPDFELSDQDGKTVKLSDFNGRKLLIYFYPKASTPGCTLQSCSVSRAKDDFKSLGVDVVGISPDKPSGQKRFDSLFNLGFPLLCDTEHKVAESYGTWGEKSFLGKKFTGIIRSSFLIDEDGKILQSWYKVSPGDTVPNAKNFLNKKD
ncbi:MAG TPA: thioredoxin-dependent thiol peroxidase [Lentisphaeria bacterium]|nr:MAG: thioredoxin-dependent thiol peroxidase [Lentisphaerae bacterium GWF2_49_21]HBC89466.1 thioredoxin-dependent thiol peroxidase [Lentisphaeria bacterium]